LNQQAEPVANRQPSIPPRLAAIIDRMLAKKPKDRYTDPAALLRDLHQLAGDGAAEGWAARPDDWSLADMIMVADDRAEATSRLDDLMKTRIARRPGRAAGLLRAAALAGCVLLGVAVAAVMGRPTLLADRGTGTPKFNDPWEHLYHAKRYDTEAAWQAAIAKSTSTDNQFCLNLARMGLAYHYLSRTPDYAKAIDPLQKMADLPVTEESFRAFGIAGLVVAHTYQGSYEEAWTLRWRFDDGMKNRLETEAPRMYGLFLDAEDELFKVIQSGN
jgi:hypothetical protein